MTRISSPTTATRPAPLRRHHRALIAACLVTALAGTLSVAYLHRWGQPSTGGGGVVSRPVTKPPLFAPQSGASRQHIESYAPPPSGSSGMAAAPAPQTDVTAQYAPPNWRAPSAIVAPNGYNYDLGYSGPWSAAEPVTPPPGLSDRRQPQEPIGHDRFHGMKEAGFLVTKEKPVSTFSIDVDTASYSFIRGSLDRGFLPQKAAVRTEELINYFSYDYPAPDSAKKPFSTSVSVYPSPWAASRKLIRIGIKGYALPASQRPQANLVFLIDTSGSMGAPDRLPLVKQSLAMLLDKLKPTDHVAIVTYAGEAGIALEPTPVSDKNKVLAVLGRLTASGGTDGGDGLRQAYALAERNFDKTGVNRVILATDGDFNVGITNENELKSFIERQRAKGVYLSVLGVGRGNYNDALMQTLAQNGNGVAAYIDTLNEARKVLVEQATSTLFTIAKDVKIQVEFNPAKVAEYRLIGYESRALSRQDFANDKVDAGDVGSGQSVTALYEIVPVGAPRVISDLRYGAETAPNAAAPESAPASKDAHASEYGFIKIRYKLPDSDKSVLMTTPITKSDEVARFAAAPRNARFATAVAGFGELLRGGLYTGSFGYGDVIRIAQNSRGPDPYGYRAQFVQLVREAETANALPPAQP